MWATVLVLALMTATEPVRLGMAMFLISGPRPMLNLLAFWLGGITTGIGVALAVLVVLRDLASMLMQDAASIVGSMVASSAVRHIQIAAGLLALLIAALITAGFSLRHRVRVPMPRGEPSASLLASTPTAFSRLRGRACSALEAGLPWLPFVVGLSSAGPPPVEYLAALAAIRASGTAIGTQFSAAVAFIVVMLVILEIPLVSYLATPAKTEVVMLRLCDSLRKLLGWQRAHSRRILSVIVAVAGVALVATGAGYV
jgi:Sap-like sulfolipid-1-addressing protein